MTTDDPRALGVPASARRDVEVGGGAADRCEESIVRRRVGNRDAHADVGERPGDDAVPLECDAEVGRRAHRPAARRSCPAGRAWSSPPPAAPRRRGRARRRRRRRGLRISSMAARLARGRALCEVVHGERHERPIDHADDLGMADRVADAQRGEPVRLAERARDHEVRMVGEQAGRVGDPAGRRRTRRTPRRARPRRCGHRLEEVSISAVPHDGAGRVVGVRDEGDLGPVGDRRSEGDEVERLVAERHPDLLGFDEPGEERIRLERRPAHRHLVAGRDVGEQDLLEQAGGARRRP